MKLTSIIKESFSQYAGAVLQSRALVDVRDAMKPSARQIFYCMYTDKFTCDKPFKKTLKAIGSSMRMYIHGDSSCEGVIMRAGQPFSMRYPLVEVDGSYGNLMETENWAAPRYTSSRLSKVANNLFSDIGKNTINEWRDNYDDTEKYPAVLPTKGYYNIVNPTMGIGVGAATNIPGFNLVEVNNALIHLLKNPDCSFEDVYCAPDFPTGCTLLNEEEVKTSLKYGSGKSCKLRATIEYDSKEHCLIVTEIPYGVYTNTICKELQLLEEDPTCGIEKHNDLTGESANIKIYLTKRANPAQVIKNLYKKTSLQSHYGINMTMLDKGRYPKVFGWKEALQAHIDHEKEVYRAGFEFDLNKINNRIHIIEGILIALARIDEVVEVIKTSRSAADASKKLQQNFLLSEQQAKAILEIKLARLARLEVEKLEDEKTSLEHERTKIEEILSNKDKFNQQLINGWLKVAEELGDERRTRIENIESEDDDEPVETKRLITYFTNFNNMYIHEDSSLISRKRGSSGTKLKLKDGETVINTIIEDNCNNILLFTSKGRVFNCFLNEHPLNVKIPISSFIETETDEYVIAAVQQSKKLDDYLTFVTKNGMIKKTRISEYNLKKSKGVIALKLKDGDSLVNVFTVKSDENVGLCTSKGYLIVFNSNEVPCSGRNTTGVKAVSLREGDYIVSSNVAHKNALSIVVLTKKGLVKKTEFNDSLLGRRTNKGNLIFKTSDEEDSVVEVLFLNKDFKELIITSHQKSLRMSINDIKETGRYSSGIRAIKLNNGDYITGGILE